MEDNNFTGPVSLINSGNNNVQITDLDALTFGKLDIGGSLAANSTGALNLGLGSVGANLTAISGGGAITQTGVLTINGSSDIDAGTAAITLTQGGNNFGDTVTLTGGATQITDINSLILGDLNTQNLTAVSIGTLNPGFTSGANKVDGDLILASNGGNITQAGNIDRLKVTGTSNFNAGTGSVSMTQGLTGGLLNDFDGNVALTAANADFFVSAVNGIDKFGNDGSQTVVTGTFTLRSQSALDFNLANGAGVDPAKFELTSAQLANMNVGTLAARASGAGNLLVGTFNPAGVTGLNLITADTGNVTVGSIRTGAVSIQTAANSGNGNLSSGAITAGSLSLNLLGSASFTQPNQVENLGTLVVGSSGLTFQNQISLNLTGSASMPGRLSLEVAGQFYNQTGAESPLAGVQLGSVIKSLSLMGGLPNSVSGLAGFSYRYDGVIPTSGNVMSYAVSPLALFAPSGTVIAGVDLSGTQTGGGQFNTFLTGSDDLNWIISDFGKFNLPKVSSAGLEYTIYPKRVEPETRTLPNSTLSQLRQELGRPPTIEEINRREVSMRQSDRLRSGSILERSSLDSAEESNEPQENAKATTPSPIEGQVPQANQGPKKVAPTENSSFELAPPVASFQLLPAGSYQSKAEERAAVSDLLVKERASAEVGLSIPVARSK